MTEASGLELIGHAPLSGAGDLMQVDVVEDTVFVGHTGSTRFGTTILDVADPRAPRVLTQIERPPGTHTHKVQVDGDIMIVNHEQNPGEDEAPEWSAGVEILDVSKPANPRRIGFFPTWGEGVHRMSFGEGPHVFASSTAEGYIGRILYVIDISDPTKPLEAGKWWLPGSHTAGGEQPDWDEAEREYAMHHALVRGERAYVSWWDAGMVILDTSDVTNPQMISHLKLDPSESACTHTALPLPERDLLVLVDESTEDRCKEVQKQVRVLDISDEVNPAVISRFPVPEGDFCHRGGRFGPHNVHENRVGRMVDLNTIYLTYFNAGLRIVDISDPVRPTEIAHYVPDSPPGQEAIQLNDLVVTEDGIIFVTDRVSGGLYVFERT
jgi:hypothetical protein